MTPRRVLHLIDTGGPGGAETVCLELAAGLDPARWRPVVVLPKRDWLWQAMEARGIEPILLKGERSFDVSFLLALRRLVRDYRIDLVQTHLLGSATYGATVARMCGLPQVSTFHGTVDVSTSDRFLKSKLRLIARERGRLVFVSESLRRFFASLSSVRGHESVIYNGIDLDVFAPGREPEIRAEWGCPQGALMLGAIGNIRPAKDYENLLRACALLVERGTTVRCVIVGQGSGPLMDGLLALRDGLGLSEVVAFAGFRDDPERVLRSLDVLVVSSSSEGFSLTTVQALATRTPVVATRCGGPEEILEDGELGVLVPTGDPEALASGIEELAADSAMRERLADRGRVAAERRFSLGGMIGAYESLYDALLGEGPTP